MEDSGVYVCEGINQAGRSRKEVELIIQGEQSVSDELSLLVIFLVMLLIMSKVFFEKKIFTTKVCWGFWRAYDVSNVWRNFLKLSFLMNRYKFLILRFF